jgi:hypothetical protein
LILGGKLAVYGGEEIVDPRGWGRISGRKIEGIKNQDVASDLAIISYYGQTGQSSSKPELQGTNWMDQEKRMGTIPKKQRMKNPKQQGLKDMQMMIQAWQDKGCNVIIGGNFNINLNKKSPQRKELVRWANELNLVCPLLNRFGETLDEQIDTIDKINKEERTYSWYKSDNDSSVRSLIDCRWVSKELQNRGCILGSAISKSPIGFSDHCSAICAFDFTLATGQGKD